MKIFGREPAMLLSIFYAAVVLFGGHVLHLDGTKQGTLNVVGAGVVTVITTVMAKTDKLAAALYGLIKAVVALVIAFGLQLAPSLQADVMTFVGVVLMYMTRQSITAPVDEEGEHVPS